MIKSLLMIAFFCLICTASNAQTKSEIKIPKDDRYFNSSASYSTHKQVKVYKVKKKRIARKSSIRPARPAGLHFLADAAQAAVTPIRRMGEAISHAARPAGCPSRAWCGCFLSKHLGLNRRDLWLARNWARVGTASHPAPGVVAVWKHHVGIVISIPKPGRIILLSGNDSNRVRQRERSIAGIIAWRKV